MDDLQVIRTFINNVDAELARGALEAAGIASMIRADDCGGTRPHLWMGGVELLVREEDIGRAEEVLASEPTAIEDGDATGE
jgi:Putative prokaryotic signal transducing protein